MRVVAICGSYQKGGVIDQTVEAVLQGARERGAETAIVQLREEHIEFCRNCRKCTQESGEQPGRCVQQDDMEKIMGEIKAADAVVLASPVNCCNVTAVFRRWMERLISFGYWPWGQSAPQLRTKEIARKAVLVASAAMPGFLIPFWTGAPRALKLSASLLNAKPVGSMWLGLVAQQPHYDLRPPQREQARKLGWKLAQE